MENLPLSSLTGFLQTIAPLSYKESYDNCGLLVKCDDLVTKALVTLDCTEDVLDEALARGCNMVIAHHPILFKGVKKLTGADYVERVVMKAIRSGISLYAIHTNLDNVHTGVNDKIASLIGLENRRILAPKEGLLRKLVTYVPHEHVEKLRSALFETGAGGIGDYIECSFSQEGTGTFLPLDGTNPFVGTQGQRHEEPETRMEVIYPVYLETKLVQALRAAHPYETPAFDLFPIVNLHDRVGAGMIGELPEAESSLEFLQRVKQIFGCGVIKHTAIHQNKVQKIAVCGGSGFFLLNQAIGAGADVFITSDVKYHEFFDADGRIILADIGHYESEQFTSDLIVDRIVKKFPTFAVLKSNSITNPVKYL